MRRRFVPVLLCALVGLVLPLAGCFADEDPTAGSFADAEHRFTEDDPRPHRFDVPAGNVTLVVAVHYVLEREATFESVLVVMEPMTHLAGLDQIGPVEEHDPRWAVVRNATAGAWQIEADLGGDGDYVFGVYFDVPGDAAATDRDATNPL